MAVLVFLFGLAIFYFTLNWTKTIGNLFVEPVLLAAYWVGYIALIVSVLILKPYTMMTRDDDIALKYIVIGVFFFLTASFVMYIGYSVIDPILGVSYFQDTATVPETANFNMIISFGFLLITVLSMDVFPMYLIMVKA